jgi:hypothetical protein
MRRAWCSLLASAAVATALVGAAGGGQAAAATHIRMTVQRLGPGIVLRKIYDPSGPTHIYELVLSPAAGLSLRTTLAGSMGILKPTSQIASAQGAVAAINGDFTVEPGHPMHSFGMTGDLTQLGSVGAEFAFSSDLRHRDVLYGAPTLSFLNLTTKTRTVVDKFNTGNPSANGVAAFTSYGRGAGVVPPANACSAQLNHRSSEHWGSKHVGVYREWRVRVVTCGSGHMPALKGTIVLSSALSGTGSTAIRALKPGGHVRLTWSTGRGYTSETVGGMPEIVVNGVNNAPPKSCSSYFCSTNSRTAVGITAKGQILLVVVDGKQPGWSEGLTLWQLAQEMIKLGARNALNLDGSGGSTMWIKGKGVINRPSDWSGERPVTNALLIKRGVKQIAPLPYAAPK